MRPLLSLAPAVALALALSACAWSVPADPGLVEECRPCKPGRCPERVTPAAAPPAGGAVAFPRPADDPAARVLYHDKCARCHEAFAPDHVTPAQWPALVRKYGPRAGLFGEDRTRVLAWLQANAR